MKRSLLRLLPAVAAIAALVPATLALGGAAPEGSALLPDLDQETPTGLVITKAARRAGASGSAPPCATSARAR